MQLDGSRTKYPNRRFPRMVCQSRLALPDSRLSAENRAFCFAIYRNGLFLRNPLSPAAASCSALIRFTFFRNILPDADLDAAVDGVHLPGIKRSEILPALALVYRRNLLQKDDTPIPQKR